MIELCYVCAICVRNIFYQMFICEIYRSHIDFEIHHDSLP